MRVRHERPTRSETLVVGAGVVGGAVALALARAGRSFAWVAPFGDQSGTATYAAGAMLGALGEVTGDPTTEGPAWELELRLRASDRYATWLEEIKSLGGTPPELRVGTFVVAGARRESDRIALAEMESAAARFGRPCERVSPSEVPGLDPAPGSDPEAAIYLASEGFVDAPALSSALVQAVTTSTRAVLIDDSVKRVIVRGDRVSGVETERSGVVKAAEVVLCAGANTQALIDAMRLSEFVMPAVLPSKGASLTLEKPHDWLREHEHVLRTPNREFACGVHVVPRSSTIVYVGATNRVSRFAGITGEITASDALYLLDGVTKEFSTELEHWNITGSSFGNRPLSVDGLPIAGRTGIAGLSVGTGTYRNGVLLAPVIAEAVLAELNDGHDPQNRLSPSHPDRRSATSPAANVLRSGLREFAELIDDSGALWWRAQLPAIFDALGALAGTDARAEELRAGVKALLERYPRVEMVPEALVELLQETRQD